MKYVLIVSLCLLLLVGCNTSWTKTAVAILEAAQPTIHNVAPRIEPDVVMAIGGLKAWKGDAAALANISAEIQVSLDNLTVLLPNLDDHQKQLAVWIGSGLQSVLAIIEKNLPPQAHQLPTVKARAARPALYRTYPDAASYKAAKPQ